jgi:hypothetical protein
MDNGNDAFVRLVTGPVVYQLAPLWQREITVEGGGESRRLNVRDEPTIPGDHDFVENAWAPGVSPGVDTSGCLRGISDYFSGGQGIFISMGQPGKFLGIPRRQFWY